MEEITLGKLKVIKRSVATDSCMKLKIYKEKYLPNEINTYGFLLRLLQSIKIINLQIETRVTAASLYFATV